MSGYYRLGALLLRSLARPRCIGVYTPHITQTWVRSRSPMVCPPRFYSVSTKEDIDLDEKRSSLYFELQMTYKDTGTNTQTKAKRLEKGLFDLIGCLPDGQFSKDQLKFVNQVVNFIDQPQTGVTLSLKEIIAILQSMLPAMTPEDVQYMNFFPRFYSTLRDSASYNKNGQMRLQFFEIFLNYVLLTNNRGGIPAIMDAFIDEENTLRGKDVSEEVGDIVIEAFKSKTAVPDTVTMTHVAEISDLSANNAKMTDTLALFFTAADAQMAQSYEDNSSEVSDQILKLLEVFEQRLESPLAEYINLLYFATRNGLDQCCQTIMEKLSRLTDGFTKETETIHDDELLAIVSSALKFKDYDEGATRLVEIFRSQHRQEDFTRCEWLAVMEVEIYNMQGDGHMAFKLLQEANQSMDLNDTETYNCILEAGCYSDKSAEFVDEFSQDFDTEYGLSRDACSFSTMIQNYLDKEQVHEAVQSFELSLQEAVAWDDDYGGSYMPTLFRMLTDYFNKTNVEVYYKSQVYKKIKVFEYSISKKAVQAMVAEFLRGNFVGDAAEIFRREISSHDKEGTKYNAADLPELFETYYRYIVTSREDLQSNWFIYEFLAKNFAIPNEFYPGLLRFWIDVGYPSRALEVFANMKQLAKENKLLPPSEDVYLYLLQSFSKFQYERGISVLQLAVKMDLSLNLDIKLLNSLMGAFCSLEDPFRVRDSFNIALAMPRQVGLNNESCYWMLKSLKFATYREVNQFYDNLSQYDVLPDANIFGELLLSNCYYEQYGTAMDKLVEAYENGDSHLITKDVLKNFHNFCLNKMIRGKLDVFASAKFPQAWNELKSAGELKENTEEPPALLEIPYQKVELAAKSVI